MDYEKKYKETIAWIDFIMPTLTKEQQEDALENFPELVENEDEKIRKEIINYFECQSRDEPCRKHIHDKWIAWLEKQGESYTKKDIDDAYLKGICDAKHELEKQGEQKPTVVDFNAKDWYVSKVDGKIHDMTYNPADKVEPKFKVGDILVRKKGKGFLYPVIDMDDKYYVIRAFYKPFAIEKKECEEFFKLVRRRENGKLIE